MCALMTQINYDDIPNTSTCRNPVKGGIFGFENIKSSCSLLQETGLDWVENLISPGFISVTFTYHNERRLHDVGLVASSTHLKQRL